MTKLELLNVFLNDRLTAAAEEIFRAVKDTVLEYQSEILRSKEENQRLQRLLNVTVQRLLLQQPEAPPLQPRDDSQPSESEFRGSMDLLPQIKEEPKLQTIQTEEEARNSEEGNRSCLEPLQESHPDRTVSITPSLTLMSLEVKTEAGRHDSDGQQLVDILPSSTTVSSHMQRSRKPHRTEQQVRGSLRSSGKHNVHLLQMKNARTLKPVSPRPSPPSPGIQRWHSCKECGKGFSFACQLEVHMRWHTKEKPYSCTVCRKSFTTVSMLKRHHRIHTGEKPFRCHVCGKCFNQSAHLNTHFRLHTRERASWSRTTGPSKT